MPEYYKGTATITTLSPIKPGHTEATRSELKGFKARSPFHSLPRTRFARFAIVPRSWPQIGARVPLRSDYLLWIATFDGSQDGYLGELADSPGVAVRAAWKHCVGWPSNDDWLAVVTYLKRARVPVNFYIAFHADVTLAEIRNSLELQRIIRDVAAKLPDLSAEDLWDEYGRKMGRTR